MDHQSVAFGIWLGIAVLALVVANVKIWQRRRALNHLVLQDLVEQPDRSMSSHTVPEPTSSIMAR